MNSISSLHKTVNSPSSSDQYKWWQKEIVYQIYPRSFQDGNGDGVGDLEGIIQRLDYLHWLGVRAIWISPIYPSPMADFGYDISDYTGIHPIFGTMETFDTLLEQVHRRGMKLILDLVPNHCSDQHPWFIESRSSRNNPKSDWFIWKDALPDGSPPNNWLAVFGGAAWEWDENRGQYYYHAFLKEQPDLNWRNPEVREAMFDVMRFWLRKGVDGFRVDVMWHLIKDELLRNNPPNPSYKPHMATVEQLLQSYSTDQPETHDVVKQMRSVVDEFEDRLLIGEIYLDVIRLVRYYGENNDEAHLPFNFLLVNKPWNPTTIAAIVDEYEGTLPEGAWPNWVLGNHDNARISTRIGKEQSRVAAMLLLTLRGTPTLYYGDEIGMTNVTIPREEIQDPQGLNMPDKDLSRDPARTPMQWNDATYAGFSDAKPWLRISDDFTETNVESQQKHESSMLNYVKRLIALRQQEAALHIGDYLPVHSDDKVLAYIRKSAERQYLVVLNMSHESAEFKMPHSKAKGVVALATNISREEQPFDTTITLDADEGLVILLEF